MAVTRAKNFPLPASVTGEALQDLHAQLSAHIAHKTESVLDAAEVAQPTTPYVQLILACLKERQPEKAVQLLNASEALRAAWADFGLNSPYPLEP